MDFNNLRGRYASDASVISNFNFYQYTQHIEQQFISNSNPTLVTHSILLRYKSIHTMSFQDFQRRVNGEEQVVETDNGRPSRNRNRTERGEAWDATSLSEKVPTPPRKRKARNAGSRSSSRQKRSSNNNKGAHAGPGAKARRIMSPTEDDDVDDDCQIDNVAEDGAPFQSPDNSETEEDEDDEVIDNESYEDQRNNGIFRNMSLTQPIASDTNNSRQSGSGGRTLMSHSQVPNNHGPRHSDRSSSPSAAPTNMRNFGREIGNTLSAHSTAMMPSPRPPVDTASVNQALTVSRAGSRLEMQDISSHVLATKRGRASSDHHAEEQLEVVGRRKRSNRAAAHDLRDSIKPTSDFSIAIYRCLLAHTGGFPEEGEEMSYAVKALAYACKRCQVDVSGEEEYNVLIDLMLQRNSQMRGQLVAKLPDLVQKMYGFDEEKSTQAVKANRELYHRIKEDNAFYFKIPDERQGMYKHGIIQAAINKMWFSGPNAEGAKFKKYFDPISLNTLALVLTAIEFIIDRWTTGIYNSNTQFHAKLYTDVYKSHLADLQGTEGHSEEAKVKLLSLRKEMFRKGCAAAGVTVNEDNRPRLRTQDLDNFAAE